MSKRSRKLRCRSRAGRPAKALAVRHGTTTEDRQANWAGPNELLLRRKAELVGNDGRGRPNDPALSENALSILFARSVLDEHQREAGYRFAGERARSRGYGSPEGLYAALSRYIPGGAKEISEDESAIAEARYREADIELCSAGRIEREETRNAAIYNRVPPWLWRTLEGHQRPADPRRRLALLRGLSVLAAHYGLGARHVQSAA